MAGSTEKPLGDQVEVLHDALVIVNLTEIMLFCQYIPQFSYVLLIAFFHLMFLVRYLTLSKLINCPRDKAKTFERKEPLPFLLLCIDDTIHKKRHLLAIQPKKHDYLLL